MRRTMWPPPKSPGAGFPEEFRRQRIYLPAAVAIAELPPAQIAAYFRENPGKAEALHSECTDKRCTPSTFIVKKSEGAFAVGWISRGGAHSNVQEFADLADAATDYLLFSLGKGRWAP